MRAISIRDAEEADLPAIRDIYNHYVETSTCTFQYEPDSAAERLEWFRERTAKHPVIVAEEARAVVGWAALSPWKSRIGYAASVESSVYIRHDCHRRGIGRLLMEELLKRAQTLGLHTVIAGVCSEHHASLALHEALGFERVAHFRESGRKFGRWLDVVYLQFMVEPAIE